MDPSTPPARRRTDDLPWPRRPLLAALWIPAAAVLLPLGGAIGAFGLWMLAPALALVLAGLVGLLWAVWSLCPSRLLRRVGLSLLLGPLIAVPLLALNTAQATDLSMRGVTHPGEVTAVRVSHGKTTTYSCTVRFTDVPDRSRPVQCGAADTVGERVDVTEDPDGLVDPEFAGAAAAGRFDLALTLFFDAALLIVGAACATAGAVLHRTRRGRARP
ncbi:hypothetical protein [Streptomyces rubellomurinus]|uniref:Uncharacterized protein n=1 Tax=Streptomyces rubellomurinus (strain ATCC 31215) TaxID=359131 RepID=A0A0F2TCB2_STRR3|nr:hypothetical protein [Streptomyces rubellomurinus]KJS60121.1 hypothetical protein VM95_22960 [Streptomyces rubellomurinus]